MQNLRSLQNIAGLTKHNSGLSWTVRYEANELPTATTPAWTKDGDATTIEISPAGYLHVISSDAYLDYILEDEDLDASVGITTEFRMKVISGDTKAEDAGRSAIEIYGTSYQIELQIFTDQICIGESIYEMDTTDDYHTYRMTLLNDTVKVYVDGVLRINGDLASASTEAKITFSPEFWAIAGVETSWDYVYYRTDGAFEP